MKKTFSPKKSAFSLIELSIVLIIIGLLIAGVTGGASLIRSSELRAAISEARGWSTAVNGFYNQFNAYPGDYGVALGSDAGAIGNGNSRIEAFTTAANPAGAASTTPACDASSGVGCSYEDDVAWLQLKNAGVVDTNVVSFGAVGATWSVASHATFGFSNPTSKIKSSGWVFDFNTTSGQNVVVLTGAVTTAPTAGNTFVNGTFVSTAAITPADALSIDTKVDDGVANTGRVRGVLTACTTTAGGATYATATTTRACALSYQVDLNS